LDALPGRCLASIDGNGKRATNQYVNDIAGLLSPSVDRGLSR